MEPLHIVNDIPPELVTEVFSRIPALELQHLFQIDKLLRDKDNSKDEYNSDEPFTHLQRLALLSKYHGERVSVGENIAKHVTLPLNELEYLVKNRLFIRPKQISIMIPLNFEFDRVAHKSNEPSMILLYYKEYFQTIETDFSLRFKFINQEDLQIEEFNSFASLFRSIVKIKYLTIAHSNLMGISLDNTNVNDSLHLPKIEHSSQYSIEVENLKLNLLSGSKVQHLLNLPNCIVCSKLRFLDLAYNNIDTESFRNVRLPEQLVSLNLSNNDITELSLNSTFPKSLQVLNASNNKILKITTTAKFPELTRIDLSCNLVKNMEQLGQFPNLEVLDLSRNLITQLHPLKLPRLQYLNLEGNYLPCFFQDLCQLRAFLPPLLEGLNVSYCMIKNIPVNLEDIIKRLNKPSMKKLTIENRIYHFLKE